LATENFVYLTTPEAIKFHVLYMRRIGETRFGVFDRNLIESALARPNNAALYENADVIRQASTLVFGLIKSHPWEGGNKLASFGKKHQYLRTILENQRRDRLCHPRR